MDPIRLNQQPSPPPRNRPGTVERYVLPGFDHGEAGLEPHLKFNFEARLRAELELRYPAQPYPGDPLPGEDVDGEHQPTVHYAARRTASKSLAQKEVDGLVVLPIVEERLKARKAAKRSAEREDRFRKARRQFEAARIIHPAADPRRAALRVARGASMNPSLIEKQDYELGAVVGRNSRFRFRLIGWGGGSTRPIYASDGSLVALLGGRPRNRRWYRDVT
ncbi:hypothetical protein DFH06DRAFT_1125229, partial [Mycena polygramma]